MQTSNVRNRLAALTVTAAEQDLLRQRADEEGRSISNFLRTRLVDVLLADEGQPVAPVRLNAHNIFTGRDNGNVTTTMQNGDEAA